MPKRVFTLVSRVRLLATQQGSGYVSADDICSLLDQASLEKWNNEYGRGSQTRNGRQVPAIAYQVNQRVTDAMQPWLRVQKYSTDTSAIDALLIDSEGLLILPDDFVHPTAFTWKGARSPVDVLDDAQVAALLSSPIEAPTAQYPAAEPLPDRAYRLFPNPALLPATSSPVEIVVKYLGTPYVPVYVEIRDDQGRVTGYNDADSVDTGWGREADPWLVARTTELLGIQEQNPQLAALGNKMVQDNT